MRNKLVALTTTILIASWAGLAQAQPLDLSTFSVFESVLGSVAEQSGTVTFKNDVNAALYFFDDAFVVDPLATTLSFDVSLVYADDEQTDYFALTLRDASLSNILYEWSQDTPGSGHADIDLVPYRGGIISVEWGLIWNGSESAGSKAMVSNMQIESMAAPVPEPTTSLLFGIGLLGLAAVQRKRNRPANC